MNIQFVTGAPHTVEADVLILPGFDSTFTGTELARPLADLDSALGGALRDLIGTGDLTGKASQVIVLYPRGAMPARRVLLLGLGKRESATPDSLRRAAASAAQRARDLKAKHVAFALGTLLGSPDSTPFTPENAAQAVAEGALLGLYTYHGQKTSEPTNNAPERLSLILPEGSEDAVRTAAESGVKIGRAMAEGQMLARTLVNLPPNICTPAYLAEQAEAIAKAGNLRCEALDKRQMESLKMGALLAVARGSKTEPKFIILEHNADKTDGPTLVLVGKGITFDTGGYSIKTADGMVAMKQDMSGAAAVLGAMQIVAALGVPFRVVGLVPSCDNMVSGDAYLPSEVITASNGTTIEVISTDAEGRLILADALVYAGRYAPAAVVDIATLTGSMTIALGGAAAGLFCTDDTLRDRLIAAGNRTAERVWPLPLFEDYNKLIESKTADIRNSIAGGVKQAGGSVGAMFLKRFTSYPAWAHIDMAAMAGETSDNPTLPGGGGSGYGARLLAEFVRSWA